MTDLRSATWTRSVWAPPTAPTTTTATAAPPRRPALVGAAAAALAVEGVVGVVALVGAFRGELWLELTGQGAAAGIPAWVFLWETAQLLAALSLPILALLVWRGRASGLFAALTLQGVAIGVSAYGVLDTLPDTLWLAGIVAVTTLLLATTPVRDWCLGPSDAAFRRLIANPAPGGPAH